MQKLTSLILVFLVIFSSGTLTALAAEIKTETVTMTKSEYKNYEFEERKEFDGKEYVLKNQSVISEDIKTFEIAYDDLLAKDCAAPQTAKNPTVPGENGSLKEITYFETVEDNRVEELSEELLYIAVPTDYEIPDVYSLEYFDEKTGSTINTELQIDKTNKLKSYWSDTTKAQGLVTHYDALVYQLIGSNTLIPKNESSPTYLNYETTILTSLGLDENSCRITGSSWDGEPYYLEGVLCRNCTYEIQTLVSDIEVTYNGKVSLPNITTYTAVAEYIDDENSKVTVELTYEKAPISKTVIAVSVVTGILIISALIAIILITLSKRRGKNEIQL